VDEFFFRAFQSGAAFRETSIDESADRTAIVKKFFFPLALCAKVFYLWLNGKIDVARDASFETFSGEQVISDLRSSSMFTHSSIPALTVI